MTMPTRGQISHVLKLIAAAIPAVVAVVAPDLSTPVQAVLAAVTALVAAVELKVHGENSPAPTVVAGPPVVTGNAGSGYVPEEARG